MDDKREGPAGKFGDLAGTVKDAADTASKTVTGVASKVAETASGAYEQGKHYARTAQEQYPEAGRRLREGGQAVSGSMQENPLVSLLIAGSLGYALGWLVHGQQHSWHEELPDYARKR